jgi:L-lactate dehydrogenase complex protein LldG
VNAGESGQSGARFLDDFDGGLDSAVLATGISATADMGATVYGVHGPRAVHAIVITDR